MPADVFGIVGKVVGGTYEVQAVVGEGGFAVVYRAFHTKFRAKVALKCLKIPDQLGEQQQQEFLEQFRGEGELLFQLSASLPTVVRPLHVDAFTTSKGTLVPFMALEWLEGETLDAIIVRRKKAGQAPLSLRELVTLLTPVARALERAHNFHGPDGPISIVHRDLKPENIFVATSLGEQVVKILDFGIGKAKSFATQVAGRASATPTGLASFTPAYGAPEQWLPKRYGQTGPWTDVWGLALTVVEALAARPILEGDHTAMMGTTIDERRRPTPRSEGVVVPDGVEQVFEQALAVDPRNRFRDAGQFWNALLAALGVQTDPDPLVPSAARMPALPAIPDLQVSAARPARPAARGAALSHGEIELEESKPLELALDLAPDERSTVLASKSPDSPGPRASPGDAVVASSTTGSLAEAPRPWLAASAPVALGSARAHGHAGPEQSSGYVPYRPSAGNYEVSWASRAAPGLALLGLSIAVTLADQAYAAAAGEVFSLGPLRALWIAVLFMLSGLGWLAYEFVVRGR
jgi:eukaryotic-like serine/threonine-protein kinase